MPVPGATAPVPAGLELTFHVTAVLGLLAPETSALSWRVRLVIIDALDGLTVTRVTVGVAAGEGATGGGAGGGVTAGGVTTGGRTGAGIETVTAALPDLEGSADDIART